MAAPDRSRLYRKVNLGFGLTLALLVAISAIAYRGMTSLVETVHWEVHTHEVLNQLDDLLLQIQNAETGQRGYIITGEERYLEPYHSALQRIGEDSARLRRLSADNPRQQERLDRLDSLIADKLAELNQTVELRKAEGAEAAARVVLTDRGQRLMDEIRRQMQAMEAEEDELLHRRDREAEVSTRRAMQTIVALIALNFALVIVLLLAIRRDLEARNRADAALSRAYGELESRVHERTAELAAANGRLQATVAELQTAEQQLKSSRDQMQSTLDELRVGSIRTDAEGRVVFLSRTARRLLGKGADAGLGAVWDGVLPLQPKDLARLRAELARAPALRSKVQAQIEPSGGPCYWTEIEVAEAPAGRIFFLYDVTEIYDLRQLLDGRAELREMVGSSPAMQAVYRRILEVAPVDATVLIEGETGTGKELVARAIHAASDRRVKPLVVVNCAALTEALVSSQLFGHQRGAFTGAVTDHRGLFEEADGGTIFLDEIGDIPAGVQTSLLRVLQEREISRLGEARARRIDVRVITATHHDLNEDVARGNFRADLLYRIRVARIAVPPLRERREDIPALVAWFLQQYAKALGRAEPNVSEAAMNAVMAHPWPGNVRELKSAIEVALIGAGEVIRIEDLPPELSQSGVVGAAAVDELPESDSRRLRLALERSGQNRSGAARLLGISRATLYRRLARLTEGETPEA